MRTWPLFFILIAACDFAQNTVAVFVNTNQTTNHVWSYTRAIDATLTYAGTFDMEGQGSAGELGSQRRVGLQRTPPNRRPSLHRTNNEIVSPIQNNNGNNALILVMSVCVSLNGGTLVNGSTMKFITTYTITPYTNPVITGCSPITAILRLAT